MSIEFSALAQEAKRAQATAKQLRGKAWNVLRKVAFDTSGEVKRQMPIDVGRARASWGNWDDRITLGHKRLKSNRIPASTQKQMAAATDKDSIWEESEDDLRVTQGSNLAYIEALNAGHSRQAPSGFLDVIAEKAALTLDAAIAQLAGML